MSASNLVVSGDSVKAKLFASGDADKNSFLSADEVLALLDSDGDGKVSKAEFSSWMDLDNSSISASLVIIFFIFLFAAWMCVTIIKNSQVREQHMKDKIKTKLAEEKAELFFKQICPDAEEISKSKIILKIMKAFRAIEAEDAPLTPKDIAEKEKLKHFIHYMYADYGGVLCAPGEGSENRSEARDFTVKALEKMDSNSGAGEEHKGDNLIQKEEWIRYFVPIPEDPVLGTVTLHVFLIAILLSQLFMTPSHLKDFIENSLLAH